MDEDFLGLVTVFRSTDRLKIEMVKTILLAEGIFHHVKGQGFSDLMGGESTFIPGVFEREVQVQRKDRTRVVEILKREIDGYQEETNLQEE